MNGPDDQSPTNPPEGKLPRRDWILLPGLGLLTIGLIAGSVELLARRVLAVSSESKTSCIIHDASKGVRGVPNSVCWEKLPESENVEYKYNRCGDRAGMECGPKAAHTYRIVMQGSSIAAGYTLQINKTIGALLPIELSEKTGRSVELYDEGVNASPQNVVLRFQDVLAAQPDLILWVLGPWEIQHALEGTAAPHQGQAGMTKHRIQQALASKPLLDAIPDIRAALVDMWDAKFDRQIKSKIMLQHYLYESRAEYLRLYLLGDKSETAALLTQPGPEYQEKLQQFDRDVSVMEEQARSAGVPLFVTMVPNRAMAAMISGGEWPAGYDPYKLDNELRRIVTSHGANYLGIIQDYSTIPSPEQLYLTVNGHPNAKGDAVISDILAKELTSGVVPALKVSAQPQAGQTQSK